MMISWLCWTGILIDLDQVVSYQNCCAAALRHWDLQILTHQVTVKIEQFGMVRVVSVVFTSVDSGLTSLPCISMMQPALDLELPSLGRECLLLTVTLMLPPRPASVLECLRSGIPSSLQAQLSTASSFSSDIWDNRDERWEYYKFKSE